LIGGIESVKSQKAAKPKEEDESIILKTGPSRGKEVTNQHEVTSHKGGSSKSKAKSKAAFARQKSGAGSQKQAVTRSGGQHPDQTFSSMMEAAQWLNGFTKSSPVNRQGGVVTPFKALESKRAGIRNCVNGRSHSAGGFKWQQLASSMDEDENEDDDEALKPKQKQAKQQPVEDGVTKEEEEVEEQQQENDRKEKETQQQVQNQQKRVLEVQSVVVEEVVAMKKARVSCQHYDGEGGGIGSGGSGSGGSGSGSGGSGIGSGGSGSGSGGSGSGSSSSGCINQLLMTSQRTSTKNEQVDGKPMKVPRITSDCSQSMVLIMLLLALQKQKVAARDNRTTQQRQLAKTNTKGMASMMSFFKKK
jgi:hypothetical protein